MHFQRLDFLIPKRKRGAEPPNFYIESCLPGKSTRCFPLWFCLVPFCFFNFEEQIFSGKSDFTLIFHPRPERRDHACLCSLPQMLTQAVWPPAYKAALQFTWNFLQDHPEAAAGAVYVGACLHENVSWRKWTVPAFYRQILILVGRYDVYSRNIPRF